MTTLERRIQNPGQKRLLALDGGGIRGMITVEILAKIERELRDKLGADDDFVLADYFDYVGGTSTGAIIATCLSLGWPVDKIRQFYLKSGGEMFVKAGFFRRFRNKFRKQKLEDLLKRELEDEASGQPVTLGSEKLRTLLMVVMRNATTDSPWPISNNPFAKYNGRDRADCNLNFPLWQLVRASTAAPTYFPPEVIEVGNKQFIFVDGGVTTYNNPAFQLFLMATVEPYNLNWEAGQDKMLIVSVGTGTSPGENNALRPDEMNLLYNAATIPSALMFAALNEQDFLCRSFGDCRYGDFLDREIGDMVGQTGPAKPKLFTYVRYNAELTRTGLTKLGLANITPKNVQKLDSVKHVKDLQRVGQAVAKRQVKIAHFNGFA
ncbi:MAG: patatin-like phospholipase family protein [Myxococcales bacterium]|nr:patatin-like phospholipase family protein [Myxococcales bacterium]